MERFCRIHVTTFCFHHITDDVLTAILQFGNAECVCDDGDDLPELTYEKQNAVHYFGSYVFHGLKRVRKMLIYYQ